MKILDGWPEAGQDSWADKRMHLTEHRPDFTSLRIDASCASPPLAPPVLPSRLFVVVVVENIRIYIYILVGKS